LDLDALKVREPDQDKLRDLYVELEFYGLVKPGTATTVIEQKKESARESASYRTIDTVAALEEVVKAARAAGQFSIDTETLIDADSPQKTDPLRSKLVSLSIAITPGEAFYFPLGHVLRRDFQNDLLIDAPGDRSATDAAEDRGLIRGGDEPVPAKAKRKPKAPGTTSVAATLLADRSPQTSVTNLPPLQTAEMKPLRDLLEDPLVRKSGQNVKYDILVLRKAGIQLRGVDFDTMLASYVLDPGRRSHGLDVLALEFLDRTMMSYVDLCGKGRTAIPFDECPIDAARDYSCEEADVILQLRSIFEPQLESTQTRPLFDDIEMPLVNVLAEVEWTGITINLDWFRSLKERFRSEREAVEEQIYETAGTRFNINSNLQLRDILFTKLDLPVLKKTSTGPSTDASVLQELADSGHALPSLLMEYRELAKLESTYLDALPELVNPTTGRLHTSFSQTVAATGRLSSSEPNLQNIPIRRELGRDIRRGFIPREGWTLVSADYSQIELRLLAHLSGDPAFVEAFRAGGDIHKQTAAIIFDVPVGDVTAEMRSRAKTINFATIYGQGAHALSKQLKIEHADARAFITRYFERFSGIRRYLDSMVEFAKTHGYVQTIFGRRRYIPELRERNFNIRAFGERAAANSPIQGSAADLIKIAMIRIDNVLRQEKLESKMLLQVHDELVFESPSGELSRLESLVKQEMESAASLSVPLVVDVGHGANWVETKA
jgi:DNA polymerase-1